MTEAGKVYEGEITIGFQQLPRILGEVVQTTPITELDGSNCRSGNG